MKWPVLTMIVCVCVIFGVSVARYMSHQSDAATPAAMSPALTNVPTEKLQAEVITFKPAAKKKLSLPAAVQADPEKHVTAATIIKADEHDHEVTAVLDAVSGETALYDRQIERPLLGFQKHTEAGVFMGINENGEQAIRLQARHEFAQVKALRIGVMGTADLTQSGARHFVGIGVWGQW